MKKLLLPLLVVTMLSISTNVTAQNLPSEGDRTFEIMISPFSSSPISFNQFRLRQFRGSDSAYRLRGDIDYESNRLGENRKDSEFYIQLAPGIEWHAFQYDRLSMYYGGELDLSFNTSRNQINEDRTDKNINSTGFFGLGINGIIGLDIHFLQRLYTGLEVGYGLQMYNYLDGEVDGNTIENNMRDIYLGRFSSSRFRLGVRF
ncbi:MAG: hypothetical protein WD267_03500 [Balneolales bacterium]